MKLPNTLFGLLCLLACSFMAQASDRVALVIGNSAYRSSPLTNPRNDASAMAALLSKAGFQVDMQLDTDLPQLQAAVDRFGQTILNPQVKFGLFYYAGHGLQQDWRNYLVPVSASIRTPPDVPKQTVDVSNLLRYMEQAQGRSFLIVLDACRNDPFAGTFRPQAKGLSQFDAPVGSLLAYATSPGNVAQDGEGENGLYTGFLLREFAVPGARLEDAFKRVRLSVRLASNGEQIPWESTSLEEDLYLFPLVTHKLSEAERDQLLEKEMTTWLRVKSSSDTKVLAEFIREYPSGSASELAQSRMNRMLKDVADQKNQRQQEQAKVAAQEAQALAVREAEARERAAQAQVQQQMALRAEEERARLAKVEALQEEARRQQAAKAAVALAEMARLAKEKALAAEQESQRLVAAQAETERLVAQRAQAERVRLTQLAADQEEQHRQQVSQEFAARMEASRQANELAKAKELAAQRVAAIAQEEARQSQRQAQAAVDQLQRVQALQAEKERQERELAAQAERERIELARLALQQKQEVALLASEQQRLLAAASTVAAPAKLSPTPFFKGYDEHQRHFSVGDVAQIQVVDMFTKARKPLVMKVTQIDLPGERVIYNEGEFASDLMGNTTTNLRGSFSTPRQFYPADLIIGKKWQTRFKQSRPNGVTYTFQYDLKVVAKESVTVPAGTFDAYKIEARGFNMELGAALERNIWVTPGVNADIAHEIKVRLRNGQIEQADRQELVSFVQAQR